MKRLFSGSLVIICILAVSSISNAQPTLTSFSPASGAVGTQVFISGTNLLNTTQVTFNGVPAVIDFIQANGTTVVAFVPMGATTGPIAVTTPGGTATSAMDFVVSDVPMLVTPVVLDIKPQTCPNSLSVKSGGMLPAAILGCVFR